MSHGCKQEESAYPINYVFWPLGFFLSLACPPFRVYWRPSDYDLGKPEWLKEDQCPNQVRPPQWCSHVYIAKSTQNTKQFCVTVTLLNCIKEVVASNLGRNRLKIFLDFSQVLHPNAGIVSLFRLGYTRFIWNPFQFIFSPNVIPFDTT